MKTLSHLCTSIIRHWNHAMSQWCANTGRRAGPARITGLAIAVMVAVLCAVPEPARAQSGQCPSDADWCGTVTVAEHTIGTGPNRNTYYGFRNEGANNTYRSNDNRTFSFSDWMVTVVRMDIQANPGQPQTVRLRGETTGGFPARTTLRIDGKTISTGVGLENIMFKEFPEGTFDWADGDERLVSVRLGNFPPNPIIPTVGSPARVGHIVTAQTDHLDGLTKARAGAPGYAFTFQWLRRETRDSESVLIPGATERTYVPTSEEEGYVLIVRVSWKDDRGNVTDKAANTSHPEVLPAVHNNEPPRFEGTGASIEVPENTPPGTRVGEPYQATDPNGDQVMYSLDAAGEAIADINMGQASSGELACPI